MNGAQADRVRIPNYIRAGAVLVKISKHLFDYAARGPAATVPATAFEDWATIRRAITTIWHKEGLRFDDRERAELATTLRRAHETLHSSLPTIAPEPADCDCAMGLSIVDFWSLVNREEREAVHA